MRTRLLREWGERDRRGDESPDRGTGTPRANLGNSVDPAWWFGLNRHSPEALARQARSTAPRMALAGALPDESHDCPCLTEGTLEARRGRLV